MKRILLVGLPVALSLLVLMVGGPKAADTPPPRQAHMVFFTLKDHGKAARDKFLASCQKYLSGHEGTLYFSVGAIAEDVVEEGVSVRDFDAALHLVFESKEAGARYLKSERHVKFVNENKNSFEKVRVFDSYLDGTK